MDFITAEQLKEQMDLIGGRGEPFLFAVDFELDKAIFIRDHQKSELRDGSRVLFSIGEWNNRESDRVSSATPQMKTAKIITYEQYREKYEKVMRGIMRGDTYLINLTCKNEVKIDTSLKDIFYAAKSQFLLYVEDCFVCFSPERFVRTESGIISSRPMKGTIKADIPNAANVILNNYKESCEHYTITDLIRNDIGAVCKRVWVESFRYLDRLKTDRGDILQVSSDIRGEIKDEFKEKPGSLIFSLLPAGSVSGAPKLSTLSLIRAAEDEPRGFYTGVFGYFNGAELDSAVMIRYIERDSSGRYWYRSGGGITVNSSCRDEYNEMLDKIYLPTY